MMYLLLKNRLELSRTHDVSITYTSCNVVDIYPMSPKLLCRLLGKMSKFPGAEVANEQQDDGWSCLDIRRGRTRPCLFSCITMPMISKFVVRTSKLLAEHEELSTSAIQGEDAPRNR